MPWEAITTQGLMTWQARDNNFMGDAACLFPYPCALLIHHRIVALEPARLLSLNWQHLQDIWLPGGQQEPQSPSYVYTSQRGLSRMATGSHTANKAAAGNLGPDGKPVNTDIEEVCVCVWYFTCVSVPAWVARSYF